MVGKLMRDSPNVRLKRDQTTSMTILTKKRDSKKVRDQIIITISKDPLAH